MKDPNERRVLAATVVSLLISMLWLFLVRPAAPPEGALPAEGAPATPVASAPVSPAEPAPAAPGVAEPTPCVAGEVPLATDAMRITLNTCGGAIGKLEIPEVPGPITVTPIWTWLWGKIGGTSSASWDAYVADPGVQSLMTDAGHFALVGRGEQDVTAAMARGWERVAEDGGVILRSTSADGLTITRTVRPSADPDVLDLSVRWESSVPLMGPLWVAVADRYSSASDPYSVGRIMMVQDGDLTEVLHAPDVVEEPMRSVAPLQWFGVTDRYFLAALLPDDPTKYQSVVKPVTLPGSDPAAVALGAFATLNQDLTPGTPVEARFRLYVGPKSVERLQTIGQGLDEAANLGFWGFFAKILLFFLHLFQAGIGNWGYSIVALTFMVRLVFYPLSARAYQSGKAMQLVQPELKALQEKYADDKEALNREMVKLFAEHNVNPLSGCFPMLVQMPVFFALYSALQHTPDLYQAQFLYLQDLSAPDPYGLLPTLMAVGMVVQQRMTPMTGMDPTQQTMMKFMPLLFAGFMFSVPAGLSVYYAVNTVLAIVQQWYNTRTYGSLTPKPATPAGG